MFLNILCGDFPENSKFRAQLSHHFPVLFLHLLSRRRPPCGRGNHLRQGNQTFKGFDFLWKKALRPVCKLLYPVGNACGHPLSADRAYPLTLLCLGRA